MTARLRVIWPEARLFAGRPDGAYRILALADEVDESLDSAENRASLGPLDLLIGCGDLPADYLQFVTDAFDVPLAYVRGNHDVGGAWSAGDVTRHQLPEPLADGRPWTDGRLTLIGFSGIPTHGGGGLQVSEFTRWRQVTAAYLPVALRLRPRPPVLVTHVAPLGINDGPDPIHRGSAALRWFAERVRPPLWLHGHTTLVTRRLEDRSRRVGPTLFYNVAGAVLVELVPPGVTLPGAGESEGSQEPDASEESAGTLEGKDEVAA